MNVDPKEVSRIAAEEHEIIMDRLESLANSSNSAKETATKVFGLNYALVTALASMQMTIAGNRKMGCHTTFTDTIRKTQESLADVCQDYWDSRFNGEQSRSFDYTEKVYKYKGDKNEQN